MNWHDKYETQKGDLGELILKNELEKRGWNVMANVTEKAHCFDFVAIRNKKEMKIAEVKTKARLGKYRATGVDVRHWNEYLNISNTYNMDLILCFVDEHPDEESVYCASLKKLAEKKIIEGKEYPNTEIAKGKILFHLSEMSVIAKLDKEQLTQLRKFSKDGKLRNYDYNGEKIA